MGQVIGSSFNRLIRIKGPFPLICDIMAAAAVCSVAEDLACAQALARQEQENEDAALARRMATLGGGVDDGLSGAFDSTLHDFSDQRSSMLYIACEIADSEIEILVDTG